MKNILSILAIASLFSTALAQETPTPVAVVRELPDGTVEVGGVRVDKAKRTISLDATMNMRTGNLEYFLVGKDGKTHESLLVTEAKAQNLHIAMLLLGVKGAKPADPTTQPPAGGIDTEYLKKAPDILGDKVWVSLEWNEAGVAKKADAEELILAGEKAAPIPRSPWIYNGSMMWQGRFLAEVDQSFLALIKDPACLINNPHKGNDDDSLWTGNPKTCPPDGTPITVTFSLDAPTPPSQ